MDEHRDIYTKPEPKPAPKQDLPFYQPTPEEMRVRTRRRIINSSIIMIALLVAVALFFYFQDMGLERNPIVELLRGPGPGTGTIVRITTTNMVVGAGIDDLNSTAQKPPPGIPPQKMAEAMGHIRMANQYLVDRDLDAAEKNVKSALEIWPEMNTGLRMLGVIYIHRGQFDQAILVLERALLTDPFSSETLNNLATAYMQKGQLEKSEDLLLNALQIRGDNFTSQVNLGLLYLLWARYDQAADHLESALQFMPDNTSIRNNYGVSLLRIGQFDRARQQFLRTLDQEPDRAQALFNMAITYALERNHTEALLWLRKALQRCTPQEAQRQLMDSDLDGLRGLPEFQALTREVTEPRSSATSLSPTKQ